MAKIVEYLGVGLPVVSTPLNSARRYFGAEPAVRFSEFSGASFGQLMLRWLEEPLELRRSLGRAAPFLGFVRRRFQETSGPRSRTRRAIAARK